MSTRGPNQNSEINDAYMAGKRTLSVTVKMSEDDLAMLLKAAGKLWPGAILTRSGIVLALAKIGAEKITKKTTA